MKSINLENEIDIEYLLEKLKDIKKCSFDEINLMNKFLYQGLSFDSSNSIKDIDPEELEKAIKKLCPYEFSLNVLNLFRIINSVSITDPEDFYIKLNNSINKIMVQTSSDVY